MAITRLTKHDSHTVRIHCCRKGSAHFAALRCVDCDTHIQWLNRQEAYTIKSLGVEIIYPLIKPEELGI